jgi:hypothetical protein
MTKDLAVCIHGNQVKHGEHYVYTEEFLDALRCQSKDQNGRKVRGIAENWIKNKAIFFGSKSH